MKKVVRKRILVYLPLYTYQHRQGFEGILRYTKENKSCEWNLIPKTDALYKSKPLNLTTFDGALVYTEDDDEWNRVLSSHAPVVLFNPYHDINHAKHTRTTIVSYDFKEDGRRAAQYFLMRNFRNFAYVGSAYEVRLHDQLRQIGFSHELSINGFSCATYQMSPSANLDSTQLSRWLSTLPRATGIFCERDARALDVISAATSANLKIPDHIAVLGFDNDETLCTSTTPPLSSISANVQTLGFEAARQLDLLLSGGEGGILVYKPNLQIITRASTEFDAHDNSFVAQAIEWMREHFSENTGIDSISSGIGCSTRFLQRHFRNTLGCSIGDKLKDIKLEAAITMLKNSEKNLEQIAYECGFSSASYLCRCIREATEHTPNEYRPKKQPTSN